MPMATGMVQRRRGRHEEVDSQRDDEPIPDDESDEEQSTLFPVLSKRSTIEFLQPLSTAALLGITAISVLTSSGQDPLAPEAKHKDLRRFLVSMPYSLFSLGILGLAFAMVATRRRHRLLGFATGFLLAELMFLVFVVGLVTIARSEVPGQIVWPVTLLILIVMVVTWSLMCTYPKFLRFSGCCADRVSSSSKKGRCLLCGGAVDLESQAPFLNTGMSRAGTTPTKSEEHRAR